MCKAMVRALFMCTEKKLHQIVAGQHAAARCRGYSNNVGVFIAGKSIREPEELRSRESPVITNAKYDRVAAVSAPGIALTSSLPQRQA